MRKQGRLVDWNDRRGFGFIATEGSGERVFVHIKSFRAGQPRPSGGEQVVFGLAKDGKKRIQAEDVVYEGGEKAGSPPGETRAGSGNWFGTILSVLFLLLVGGLVFTARVQAAVAAVYAVASIAAFLAYSKDKTAAAAGGWRVPEITLHLLSLVGGWPGALAGQRLLHHKTRKASFRIVFWLTVALNILILAWLAVPK